MQGSPALDLRDLWCRVAQFFGYQLCVCCIRWHRKSRMDTELEGMCDKCGVFVWWDRMAHKAGFK